MYDFIFISCQLFPMPFFFFFFLRIFPLLAGWCQSYWHCWQLVIEQLLNFQHSCCHAEMGIGLHSACLKVKQKLWLKHFSFCRQECTTLDSHGKHLGTVPTRQSLKAREGEREGGYLSLWPFENSTELRSLPPPHFKGSKVPNFPKNCFCLGLQVAYSNMSAHLNSWPLHYRALDRQPLILVVIGTSGSVKLARE